MTVSNPALAQLKDIHTPEAIGAFPFAIGYWILLLIAFLLVAGLIYLYLHKQKQSLVKKAALSELSHLNIDDNPEFAIEVNAILKRAALSYLHRSQVASVDGKHWYQFLDIGLPQNHRGKFAQLLNQRYHKQGLSAQEKQQLFELAKLWLNKSLPLKFSPGNAVDRTVEAKC